MNALLRRRLDALAADVGRLRRHLGGDTYSSFLAGRVAENIDGIDALISPTAAERYRERLAFEDEERALAGALAASDERVRKVRKLLGDDGEEAA